MSNKKCILFKHKFCCSYVPNIRLFLALLRLALRLQRHQLLVIGALNMFPLVRTLPFLLSSLFLLSSCGGGGGNDNSNSTSSQSSVVIPPVKPVWKDAGTLGSNILISGGDKDFDQLFIEKVDSSGNITRISPALVKGGKIAQFALSPDGKKIVYLADQETDNVFELYLMNIDGSFKEKVSNKAVNGDVRFFSWSPNSQYILYKETLGSVDKYYMKKFDSESSSEIVYTDSSNTPYTISSIQFSQNGEEYTYLALNQADSHLVTVDLATGKQKKDQVIHKNLNQRFNLSPTGKYFSYQLGKNFEAVQYIQNTETGTENVLSNGPDFSTWWSPTSDKLATFDFNYLSLYDPATATSNTILDLSNDDVSFISWVNFWEKNGEYAVFSVKSTDTYVVPFNGGTPYQLKQVLGTTEKISDYRVSSSGKLLALTEGRTLYTMNLDGSAVQQFNNLTSLKNVRSLSWSPDLQYIFFRHYDETLADYVLSKINLSTGDTTPVVVNKPTSCFILESNSERSCVSYFDET